MALSGDNLKPIYPKYDYKFTHRPKIACATYLTEKNPLNLLPPCKYKTGGVKQLSGPGALTTEFIDWKGKARALFYHHPSGKSNVICANVSDECNPPPPVICRERTRTRCTQTRYRESSAQTRSYQPEIGKPDKENYQNFEIYEISKLIDTWEPPGEYEAKVVERHRRRRQYEKALNLVQNDKQKHNAILEAMEWEEWVAREEDITGYQMLRMEIVKRMFNERDEKFRITSEKRMAKSTDQIQEKRLRQLKNINTEYARGMRRLDLEKQRIKRCYRKGNITKDHIDPASDLHAPQMRFGVNPNRRHFVGFRKNFDDRINDLDKKKDERGMASLICPFSKLRSWAKPKERMMEISQRFCSDDNLKNLYENLEGLRSEAEASKPIPRCLKRKTQLEAVIEVGRTVATRAALKSSEKRKSDHGRQSTSFMPAESFSLYSDSELTENLHERRAKDLSAKSDAEILNIIGEFEGSTVGKLLKFLNEELERLKQQKKFQAIYMLAERKRWKREAYEAGRRQKETKLRENCEELYNAAANVHRDTASLFLESVLEEEFSFTSELLAKEKIVALARDIDYQDLECIRKNGKEQSQYCRAVIMDYVQNQLFATAEARLNKEKTQKMEEAHLRAIEEELCSDVERALMTEYPVNDGVAIVGELLDELIVDAVVYDFDLITQSSEDEFELATEVDGVIDKLVKMAVRYPGERDIFTDTTDLENHITAKKEAKAIIRKMVRRSVPEERWKTEVERIVEQTVSETFNDAVYEVECLKASRSVRNDDKLNEIISDIYKRMGSYMVESEHQSEHTSTEGVSPGGLRSFRSTYDIFENVSYNTSGEPSFLDNLQNLPTTKINYINRDDLDLYAPPLIGRRHERYDIRGKVAKRFQHEECCGGSILVPESSDSKTDSDATDLSEGRIIGYTSNYQMLVQSRVISTPWLKSLHPELLGDGETTFQRSHSSYDMTEDGQRINRERKNDDRRASY